MKIQIPEIIADDEDKVIAFLAGASDPGENEDYTRFKVMVESNYPNLYKELNTRCPLARETDMAYLWPRERALVRCYKWGYAIRYPNPPFHHAPVEKERIGSLDAYEYIRRNGVGFFAGGRYLRD